MWLLKGSEKRMTNAIDVAVRENILKEMNKSSYRKFIKPSEAVNQVQDILENLVRLL